MEDRLLDFVALGILIFVVLTIIYGVIYIHDIPYEIAKKRNHPHCDAIHTAGWVSLFLMHSLWPFLWIWASLYHKEKGWNLKSPPADEEKRVTLQDEITALHHRLEQLESQLSTKDK